MNTLQIERLLKKDLKSKTIFKKVCAYHWSVWIMMMMMMMMMIFYSCLVTIFKYMQCTLSKA